MRLGKYPCVIKPGTHMYECYGKGEIDERHRHRYEFNNDFRAEMEEKGLVIAGTSPDGRLVEAVELPDRDFHIGVQFHPEFKSRPNRAHPPVQGLYPRRAAAPERPHAARAQRDGPALSDKRTYSKRTRAFRHGSFLLYQLYRQAGRV